MVNTYKLKLTNLQQKILRLFFIKSGVSLNQRGIARILEVSQPAVMKALPRLSEERMINVKQDNESKRWSVELNRDNHKVIQLKRSDNLKQIYESGLADFLEKEFAGATIIIFGSYGRGDDTETSDVDIAVIGRKDKLLKLEEFELALSREITVQFYNSWKEIYKYLKNNILSGILLSGSVDL